MSSRENPIVRPTARIILLDPQGRTLLFRSEQGDVESGRPFWFGPGGGLEPGEDHLQAAARELQEETGLSLPIGPCVWLREHTWPFGQEWVSSVERYFVVHAPTDEVRRDEWTELELQTIAECRWWSVAEMRESDHLFTPRSLAELLPPILAGQYPAEPIQVGI